MRISMKKLRNLIVESISDDYKEKFRERMKANAEHARILCAAIQRIAALLPCDSTLIFDVRVADHLPKEFNNIDEAIEYASNFKQIAILRICLYLTELAYENLVDLLILTCSIDGYHINSKHRIGYYGDNTQTKVISEKWLLKQASCTSFEQLDSNFKQLFSNNVKDYDIEIKGDVEVDLS